MSDIASLIEQDRAAANRCFFHGTTSLGGTDACRPELQEDGTIILRSLNLSHVAYRVTEDEYREIRKHPQRKVGMWDFVREDDADADHIASATRAPQSAGRRIGNLERSLAAKDAELAKLREENDRMRRELNWIADRASDRTVPASYRIEDVAEAARDAARAESLPLSKGQEEGNG